MFKQLWTFLTKHPIATFKGVVVLLLAFVILQNYGPTSIDFFFWTLTSSPKVVVILVSIIIGAIGWELFRPAVVNFFNAKKDLRNEN